MKNTALLLIDFQNDYFPGGRMELSGAEEALMNAQQLLESAREKGVTKCMELLWRPLALDMLRS